MALQCCKFGCILFSISFEALIVHCVVDGGHGFTAINELKRAFSLSLKGRLGPRLLTALEAPVKSLGWRYELTCVTINLNMVFDLKAALSTYDLS